MSSPLISIITVNYNQAGVTHELLASLENLTYSNFDVWVVDNGSFSEPILEIGDSYTYPINFIRSEKNLGFAGGNNLAMRKAKGEYVLLINNDTEITPNLLQKLLEPFKQDSKVGVCCPKIKYFYQPDTIQYAGFSKMHPVTGRVFAYGSHQKDSPEFNKSGQTYGAHGAAMMLSQQVLKSVGLFDESYFLYYEEWDWSTRIMKAGYKIYYQANATVYHKESVSTGKGSPLKTYYLSRNRILYILKNSSLKHKVLFVTYFALMAAPKAIISHLSKKEFTNLNAYLKGLLWHINPRLGSF